ncbi:MAG: hypothetical protein ACREL9_08370 [Gemmatimonadales bacterium]
MTGGQAVRRSSGQFVRYARAIGGAVLLSAGPPDRLTAQVGHDPARSPYRDIPSGTGLTVLVGTLGGDRGSVGVGQGDGVTTSLRSEIAVGRAMHFTAGVSYAQMNRFIVDPTQPPASRRSGPIDDNVTLVDAGLLLLLTGAKTWHGIAPYVAGSLGMAFGGRELVDPSTYEFGTKFTLAGGAGVRWYPGRRVSVQLDARFLFWKLRYPTEYKVPNQVDGSQVLATNAPLTEWARQRWLSLGVGWTF